MIGEWVTRSQEDNECFHIYCFFLHFCLDFFCTRILQVLECTYVYERFHFTVPPEAQADDLGTVR